MHPLQILERYWNYTSFRPQQEDIIDAVLQNKDVFVLLPTGGGKSLCYQIPGLIREGICIVISPLVALMKDQVNNLKAKGIKAIALTSGIPYAELDTLLDNCIYGNYKFLYLSPERLQQALVQERIQQMNVNLIAVDEAHCISQWGHDFRPAYQQINVLRQWHPHVNVIALTATAKSNVISDITKSLDLIDVSVFKDSFYRANIHYNVVKTNDKLYQLDLLLKTHQGPSIIYVRNRRETDDIDRYLKSKKYSSTTYHGGLTSKEKQDRLMQWTHNQTQIMVATTAFGMGIDKADVKTVIHFNLPESLESYYQEAGRAGRNKNDAFAIILTTKYDEERLKNQFLSQLPSVEFIKLIYKKLCNYFQVSYGEGQDELFQFNFKKFCTTYQLNTGLTYNSLLLLDRNSIISLNQQFNFKTTVQFVVSNPQIFDYLEKHPKYALTIKSLLRTYGGIFDYATKINLSLIAEKSNLPEDQLIILLKNLEKDGIIVFELANTDSEIIFLKPREDELTINPIAKIIEQQHTLKHQQVNAVINYINTTTLCRSRQLLAYFGETVSKDCGICSVCLSLNTATAFNDQSEIENQIVAQLLHSNFNSRQLSEVLKVSEKSILNALRNLLESEKIIITSNNTYQLK